MHDRQPLLSAFFSGTSNKRFFLRNMLLRVFAAALWAGTTFASSPAQAPLTFGGGSGNTIHVTHKAHPHHSLSVTPHRSGSAQIQGEGNRIAEVCPGATDGYTGYLNKGDKQCVL